MNDLKFALRQLRKSPGFTLAAVLTLGVGVGINVAIYSVIHSVLLSELPYPEPDRLVAISETGGGDISPTSYPDYLDWRAAQHSFDDIAFSKFLRRSVAYSSMRRIQWPALIRLY